MDDTQALLDHMHRLHLILADEVKRICEKHKIKYFMIAGTMLGAVRHGGFIPWDDDMDFGMLRQDYERFLKVCAEEIDGKKFFLQTAFNDKFYTFNFAKLRLNGTAVKESFSSEVRAHQGIYIDIFPLDNVADGKIASFFQLRRFWFYRNLLWIKCGYGDKETKGRFSYRCARILAKCFSIGFLKRKKEKIISRYAGKRTERVVTSDGTYGLKKETLPAKWAEQIRTYSFEDRQYPGFAAAEEYLRYFYGDYMRLPPVEERNHHGRLEVDFGEY